MIHKIYLGADHGGFHIKELIKRHLSHQSGYEIFDEGTQSEASVDYPPFALKVASLVVRDPKSVGILCCGSGIGVSIAANKVKGIRAAFCNTKELAKLAREHNGANILTLGGRTQNFDDPLEIVDIFLTTPLDPQERHQRRRDQLDKISC